MLYQIEPEIQDGSRALKKTQELFTGSPKSLRLSQPVTCSWYGTQIDPMRGAFCMVKEGAGLEDLVGEFLRIRYLNRSVTCYCLGESAEIGSELATTRRAFQQLDILPKAGLRVYYEAIE